jgi:hypothetical protein
MRSELDGWLAKAEYPFLNEAYQKMPLQQSILQQAADRTTNLPMHHVITRLKLSPEQYAAIPEIRSRYYGEDNKPKDRTAGRVSWERAEQSVAKDIGDILNDRQKMVFDKMMSGENKI